MCLILEPQRIVSRVSTIRKKWNENVKQINPFNLPTHTHIGHWSKSTLLLPRKFFLYPSCNLLFRFQLYYILFILYSLWLYQERKLVPQITFRSSSSSSSLLLKWKGKLKETTGSKIGSKENWILVQFSSPWTSKKGSKAKKMMMMAELHLRTYSLIPLLILLSILCHHESSGQQSSDRNNNFGQRQNLPSSFLSNNIAMAKQRSYFILASNTIRPGQVYRVTATVYQSNVPITVRASIQRNGVELASGSQECKELIPETLLLRVPPTSLPGHYKLRVEGNLKGVLGGTAFLNETILNFNQRSMTIFITTDKPIYMQSQIVKFRAVPVTTDLKAFSDSIDVYMLDPTGSVMRRWLSRQSNLGAVSLEYPLSQQPVFGNWTIKVVAQGQEESKSFLVEEYCKFETFLKSLEFIFPATMIMAHVSIIRSDLRD